MSKTNTELLEQAEEELAKGNLSGAQELTRQVKAGRKKGESGGVADYLRIAGQGLLFGAGDELTAMFGSLAGGDYDEIQQREQARVEQFQSENPKTAMALEVAGGLAGGGLLGGALKAGRTAGALYGGNVMNTPSTAGRIAGNTMGGVSAGALYGAGSAEPGERLEGALMGGALGGAVGGTLGPIVDRMLIGKSANAVKRTDPAYNLVQEDAGLMARLKMASEVNVDQSTTIADVSPQAQNMLKRNLSKMLISRDPAQVAEAKRFIQVTAERNNSRTTRAEGMLAGQDMPFNAKTNPSHYQNMLDEMLNSPNPNIQQVAANQLMTGQPIPMQGATGDIRGMLESFKEEVGKFMYGPHYDLPMGDMKAFTSGKRYGHSDMVNQLLHKHQDAIAGAHDPNSWRVWQGVRSDLAKAVADSAGKNEQFAVTARGTLAALDKKLDTVSNGALTRANAAYTEIFQMSDAYDDGLKMVMSDRSGKMARQVLDDLDTLPPAARMSMVYGIGEGMTQKLGTLKNSGSLTGYLDTIMAEGTAGKTKRDILKKILPPEQVKIVDYLGELEGKMKDTAKTFLKLEKDSEAAKGQGDLKAQFFALTTELAQQGVNTMAGSVPQLWAWGLVYSRLARINGSLKLRTKDKELTKLLTETGDIAQKLGSEIQKSQEKIKKAGEIAQQGRAQLSKFGMMSGLQALDTDTDIGY